MKNKKPLIFILITVLLLIIISVLFLNIKNNKNNNEAVKELGNYKLEKLSKEDAYYVYKNNWKVLDATGMLTIKYNEKEHTIKREQKANEEGSYIDTQIDADLINGDIILNDNKDSMLVYENGFIPYINNEKNIFGVINTIWGFNIEFDDNKKIIDIFDTAQYYSLNVFLLDDITIEELVKIKNELDRVNGIKKIAYVSKEEALETMKNQLGTSSNIFNGFNNPFPASFKLYAETLEDAKNIEKEIKSKNLNIKNITTNFTTVEQLKNSYMMFDIIIKDTSNNIFYFANTDITTKKTNYSKELYNDIYVVRGLNRDLEGFIVTKENDKKVFLDKYRDSITQEYSFMNYINVDNKSILVCSNSVIESKNDFENAEFSVLDLKGNKVNIDKKEFIENLELEQRNYTSEDSIEYQLFI